MADLNTTRRGILGAIAIAPVAAAVPAFASSPSHPALNDAIQLEAEGKRMNDMDCPQEQWDAWIDKLGEAYTSIEGLPNTPENARIRAKAVLAMTGDEFDDFFQSNSSAERMVRQIIFALAAH